MIGKINFQQRSYVPSVITLFVLFACQIKYINKKYIIKQKII
jgi:hypothetical protein